MSERESCLICSAEEVKKVRSSDVESLNRLFQTLCLYMKWNPPPESQFSFYATKTFPFCSSCHIRMWRLHKLHQRLEGINQNINRIILSMSSKIIESHTFPSQASEADPLLQEGSLRPPTVDYKYLYYIEAVQARYNPQVVLTSEEKANCDLFPFLHPLTAFEDAVQCQYQESSDVHETVADSGRWVKNDSDENILQDDYQNSDTEEDMDSNGHDNVSEYDPLEDESQSQSVVCSEFEEEETARVQFPEQSESIASSYKNETDSHKGNVSVSHGALGDHADLSDQLDKCHLFSGTKYAKNIRLVGDNKFSFDEKRFFELVDGNEWHCLHCGMKSMYKYNVVKHFCFVGAKMCFGNQSQDMLKECKYNHIVYDQLKNSEFECRICPFIGKTRKDMERHIDKDHPPERKRWRGTVKQISTNLFESRNQILLELLADGTFRCGTCQEIFPQKHAARRHAEQVHARKGPKIRKTGPDQFLMENKHAFAFSDNVFVCSECQFSCKMFTTIRKHVQMAHLEKCKHMCEICGSGFLTLWYLKHHQKQQHSTTKSLSCPHCGKDFFTKRSLRRHVTGVHGDKNLICDTCGLAFTIRHRLAKHLLVHIPVTCHICGYEAKASSIKDHIAGHEGKRFQCDQCPEKSFKTASSLKQHRKSCGGLKPYACDICSRTFTQKHSVKTHKNSVHSQDKTMRNFSEELQTEQLGNPGDDPRNTKEEMMDMETA